ncbi:large ribosomal subunit protein eL28y-like isoform X1 [Aegilops tauschii subsp. strangulata]|uniref:large ribosomal subunit protein eL28y-like isoform X1 n=1 Tax=Aegilops tauschii subsp. strangulata TaxID=200361 RepID=UPI001E1CA432|nr:60S ribosomal protein L28-2-like [Aegilops tauschii subsp. strangulata]
MHPTADPYPYQLRHRFRTQAKGMTTVPGSPVWELVKKNNYFLIKQFGNSNTKVQFSKEPNNLYNIQSYKFSGLANSKTMEVQPSAGEDKAVVLSTTKTKKQNTPAKLQHKTLMRKEFRKMAICQELGINSRVLYLNCPYAWLLSYNCKSRLVSASSVSSELWHGMLDFLVDLCP